MKKTLTTFSVALLLALSACGPTPEEAARGSYHLDVKDLLARFDASVKTPNSLSRSMRMDLERSAGYIVLEPEGKMRMNQGGPEINDAEGTWAIEEGKLKLAIGADKRTATLENDVITLVVNNQVTGTRKFVKGDPIAKKGDAEGAGQKEGSQKEGGQKDGEKKDKEQK